MLIVKQEWHVKNEASRWHLANQIIENSVTKLFRLLNRRLIKIRITNQGLSLIAPGIANYNRDKGQQDGWSYTIPIQDPTLDQIIWFGPYFFTYLLYYDGSAVDKSVAPSL